jgi:hypothetical protein
MLCGTHSIIENIPHIQTDIGHFPNIIHSKTPKYLNLRAYSSKPNTCIHSKLQDLGMVVFYYPLPVS